MNDFWELFWIVVFTLLGWSGCIANNSMLPSRYRWMCAAALFISGAGLRSFLVRHGG
jgi:hypothetical protein